jgi:hypothetical protein
MRKLGRVDEGQREGEGKRQSDIEIEYKEREAKNKDIY